jgi:hypothetical protein
MGRITSIFVEHPTGSSTPFPGIGWALLLVAAVSLVGQGAEPPQTLKLKDILTYVRDPAPYKTYVQELKTPAGRQALLDAPADHLHHHALMFGIGADDSDFWGEFPDGRPGKQQPRETTSTPTSITQTIDWLSFDNQPLLQEKRVVRLETLPKANLVTWTTRLQPAPGKTSVKLWGRHYFGLGFRFIREWDNRTQFLHAGGAAGKVVRGDERLTLGDWCAGLGTIDGQPVTVALFGHPSNPRHPTEWFTMGQPFAYLSATLKLETEPLQLAAGDKMQLIYGIALLDGHAQPEQIQKLYEIWQNNVQTNGKE